MEEHVVLFIFVAKANESADGHFLANKWSNVTLQRRFTRNDDVVVTNDVVPARNRVLVRGGQDNVELQLESGDERWADPFPTSESEFFDLQSSFLLIAYDPKGPIADQGRIASCAAVLCPCSISRVTLTRPRRFVDKI